LCPKTRLAHLKIGVYMRELPLSRAVRILDNSLIARRYLLNIPSTS
jgi:hypothetical protein